jgi:hypothetical protein
LLGEENNMTEKKTHWIHLNGSVELDVDTDLDNFSDEFCEWLESKGWAFAGVFKPNVEEDSEEDISLKSQEELMKDSAAWIKQNMDIVPMDLKLLFARFLLKEDEE